MAGVGLVDSLRKGDALGVVTNFIGLYNPTLLATWPVGPVLIALQLLQGWLNRPKNAWGSASIDYKRIPSPDGLLEADSTTIKTIIDYSNPQITVRTEGENFGPDYAKAMMQGLVDALQQSVAEQNKLNPKDGLGIIAQRMPSLTWRAVEFGNDKGYAFVDIDPTTGQQRSPQMRWDDLGNPTHRETRTDPYEQQFLFDAMMNSALEREAIAPLWEVKTAILQEQAGDPNAGLSEAERAAKMGYGLGALSAQGKQIDKATGEEVRGQFKPIALDMNGNGRIDSVGMDNTTAVFDWDGNGFAEKTAWINGSSEVSVQNAALQNKVVLTPKSGETKTEQIAGNGDGSGDAFLWIDRNPNGNIDQGRELFSNSQVANEGRGIRSLAAYDANHDGYINESDPIYAQLKIWKDLNNDGELQAGEAKSLKDSGIKVLDWANNRYGYIDAQGVARYNYMGSPDLEHGDFGIRETHFEKGVQIEVLNSETGDYDIRTYVTRPTTFEVNNVLHGIQNMRAH
jgi:hypothetical protein